MNNNDHDRAIGQRRTQRFPQQQAFSGPPKTQSRAKRILIPLVVIVSVVALMFGSFLAFRSLTKPAPNPSGLSDDAAKEFMEGGVNSCEFPPEIFKAAGVHDVTAEGASGKRCAAIVKSEDGKVFEEVSISIGGIGSEGESSPVEGWHEDAILDNEVPQSFDEVVEKLQEGDRNSLSSYASCDMRSKKAGLEEIELSGSSCELLYPLAQQLNNAAEQAEYLTQDSGLFESKEPPYYVEIEPAVLGGSSIAGFEEEFAKAPKLPYQTELPQEEFSTAPLRVTGVRETSESSSGLQLCIDLEFALGELKDSKRKRGNFSLPTFAMISSLGESQEFYSIGFDDRRNLDRMKPGEKENFSVCNSLDGDRRTGQLGEKFVLLMSFDEHATHNEFSESIEPEVVGKYERGDRV